MPEEIVSVPCISMNQNSFKPEISFQEKWNKGQSTSSFSMLRLRIGSLTPHPGPSTPSLREKGQQHRLLLAGRGGRGLTDEGTQKAGCPASRRADCVIQSALCSVEPRTRLEPDSRETTFLLRFSLTLSCFFLPLLLFCSIEKKHMSYEPHLRFCF